MLQLAGCNLLLVRNFLDFLGNTRAGGGLLAPLESGRCPDDLIGYGNRLLCQLDQKSDFPLWHHRTALPDCCRAARTLRHTHYSDWKRLHVADCATGIGSRIPPGVAVYVASEIMRRVQTYLQESEMTLTLDNAPDCILIGMSSNGTKSAFQIGELAKRSQFTVDAIRFYERRKLLPTPIRTTGRFRLYTENDVERLRFVRQMQMLRFFPKGNCAIVPASRG